MAVLSSILQRQLVYKQSKSRIPFDFAVKSFCCHRVDEHIVRGRDEEMEVPPFASQFSKSELGGHLLATADEDGSVKLIDTRKYGYQSILKEWTAHSNAIFDIAWMEGEGKLVTASGDQTAVLWDVETGKCLSVFKGHSCSLKSVNFRENDIFTFSTGARDGNIMVWDIRCNVPVGDGFYKPVITIRNAHIVQVNTPQRVKKRSRRASVVKPVADSQQSVTAVIFQDENKLISAGAMDGNIKIWDLRKNYSNLRCDPLPCHVFPYPGNEPRKHGFSSLILDSNQSKLFASCTNNKIYMYECTVLQEHPVCSFSGHRNSTFYVKSALSPDNTYLLSGSSDNNAYIWRVNEPQVAPFVLKGHEGEVTSVAWCPIDLGKLVTCSDDNNVRIWRINCNQEAREKTDFIGRCEQTKQMPCSPQHHADLCSPVPQYNTHLSLPTASPGQLSPLNTPAPVNRGQHLRVFQSPTSCNGMPCRTSQKNFSFDGGVVQEKQGISLSQGMSCKSKITQPLSPGCAFASSPFAPASTPSQRKQGSLKMWLKATPPKKTLKENLDGKICTAKKKCLMSGAQSENEDIDGHSNTVNLSDVRSMDFSSHLLEHSPQSPHSKVSSPARKRQCITGPSSLTDNSKNSPVSNENFMSCQIDEEEKENIDTCNLDDSSNTKRTDKRTESTHSDKSIQGSDDTWVIKWRNTELSCKKTDVETSGAAEDSRTCEEIPKLVPAGQSILKYFKRIPSPIKENK